MLCKVDPEKLAKALNLIQPSLRIAPAAKIQADRTDLKLYYSDGAFHYCLAVPAETEEPGFAVVDLSSFKKVVGNFSGEIVIYEKENRRRLIVEGNSGRSIYSVACYDEDDFPSDQLSAFDEAQPYAILLGSRTNTRIVNKLALFLEKQTFQRDAYLVPDKDSQKLRLWAFSDPIAACVSLDAEVYDETVIPLPIKFVSLPILSISIEKNRTPMRVIGVLDGSSYVITSTETPSQSYTKAISVLEELVNKEPIVTLDDESIWSPLIKALEALVKKTTFAVVYKCHFDFTRNLVYVTEAYDGELLFQKPTKFQFQKQPERETVSFSANLLKLALSFVPSPEFCGFIDRAGFAVLKLSRSDRCVLIASLRPEEFGTKRHLEAHVDETKE